MRCFSLINFGNYYATLKPIRFSLTLEVFHNGLITDEESSDICIYQMQWIEREAHKVKKNQWDLTAN